MTMPHVVNACVRDTAEVLLLDHEVAVFRSGVECKFYIAGPVEEVRCCLASFIPLYSLTDVTFEQNELILVGVLDVLYDTVAALLRGQVDKKTMLDNLELVLLTIDEAVRDCCVRGGVQLCGTHSHPYSPTD